MDKLKIMAIFGLVIFLASPAWAVKGEKLNGTKVVQDQVAVLRAQINTNTEEICALYDLIDPAKAPMYCGHYRVVFLSSQSHDGDFGGLSGADTICQNLADNAGLPGTYMAWMSSESMGPVNRFNLSQYPYVMPQTHPFDPENVLAVAADWDGLLMHDSSNLAQDLINPIMYDEYGQLVQDNLTVSTGTRGDGYPQYGSANMYENGYNCSDWSTNSADITATCGVAYDSFDGNWTDYDTYCIKSCAEESRLYCVQQ
jgi:hypothetical protein